MPGTKIPGQIWRLRGRVSLPIETVHVVSRARAEPVEKQPTSAANRLKLPAPKPTNDVLQRTRPTLSWRPNFIGSSTASSTGSFNAQFTARYFESTHASGAADLEVFEQGDHPRAIRTSYVSLPHLFALFVGYDPADTPKKHRQYRSVIASCMDDARASGRPLFLSTGAADFKRSRGGVVELEYEAVFDQHLRPHRRLPWLLTQQLFARAFESLDMDRI